MEKMTISEVQARAEAFADGLMEKLDKFNKEYVISHPASKPLVLGRCPNCDYDLSKFITRMRLIENSISLMHKHYEIVPDGEQGSESTEEAKEADTGVTSGEAVSG